LNKNCGTATSRQAATCCESEKSFWKMNCEKMNFWKMSFLKMSCERMNFWKMRTSAWHSPNAAH
jgi:hypothetical protein